MAVGVIGVGIVPPLLPTGNLPLLLVVGIGTGTVTVGCDCLGNIVGKDVSPFVGNTVSSSSSSGKW